MAQGPEPSYNALHMWEWQNILLVAGAGAFVLFLLWRMRPIVSPRVVHKLAKGALEARERARKATSPRERAVALCDAGDVFAAQRGGTVAALGYYVRAMRSDPTWVDPVDKLHALLFDVRPRALESVLWRKLARLEWEGETLPVVIRVTDELAELYKKRIRDRAKARALARLKAHITAHG